MRPLRRLSCLLLIVLWSGLVAAQPADVRVRLFGTSAPDAVAISGAGTVVIDGLRAGQTTRGAISQVERHGSRVRISGGGVEGEGLSVELAPDTPGSTLHVVSGRQTVDVIGPVTCVLTGDAFLIVNRVPLPNYVSSVVASEYGFSEIEGVKAQAILARTYAVRQAAASRRAYDVDDHQGSQVYRGTGVETETSRRAERETRSQILTYGGQPAEALYSSSSGGHTADNETIWGTTPLPYLRGVPDPYDAAAPDHTWQTSADAARVRGVLSRRYGGTVTGIEIAERSREGRVVRVRVIGSRETVISGSDFRTVINGTLGWRTVRSTLFSLSLVGDQYVLTGGGFGHGVGMSQYGARAQARAGRTYLEILSFYFAGTQVTGGNAPLLALERPASERPTARPPATPQSARPPSAQAPAGGVPPTARPPAAPPRRNQGEAIVLRPPPTAVPTAAPTARQPSAPAALPTATEGARWPTPPRAPRSGW
ncbi:MAG TPA: SpoIID/LytB domain-containing protein [Rubricoccaceae bacterium]|jgi:stage II sporulation protein D